MTTQPTRTRFAAFLPIASELDAYERSWFRGDLMAAITVWAIVIPESVAYASIAGLPPETGLYAATIPLLAYALFGSSRRITVGPGAAVAALSFATIAPFAAAGTEEFVALTVLLALLVGGVLIVAGIARMGVVADFLSEPVLKGFIVGVALTIALGQAGKLFGFETEGEGFFTEAFDLIRQLPELHLPTLAVGVTSLVALVVLERLVPKIPATLVVVVGSILAVKGLDLIDAGVAVVGAIPSGLPSLAATSLDWSAAVDLIPGAIVVAIVVFGQSMALSKTFSARYGERVDADQELIALGAANATGGLFGAFATNVSSSRSAAGNASGQKTQVSSLIVVALLVVTLLFLTPLFTDLPEAALGAIVINAVASLIRFRPIATLKDRNNVDFWAAVATLTGVLVFDIFAGLMIGVLVSIAGLMARAVRPRIVWLGRDASSGLFRNRDRAGVDDIADVSIVQFGGELFFANVGSLRDAVLAEVDERQPKAIVLDAEAVIDVDTTAADELVKLVGELASRDVLFAFARLRDPARHAIVSAGIEPGELGFVRIDEAVDALTAS
ncbi:MAG: SulP family inorganic anion transporter [Acidimicrobiia bacterium]|nr:MAG: SulP family inorganic anion transporter [Acidimicrobiia bacterium]